MSQETLKAPVFVANSSQNGGLDELGLNETMDRVLEVGVEVSATSPQKQPSGQSSNQKPSAPLQKSAISLPPVSVQQKEILSVLHRKQETLLKRIQNEYKRFRFSPSRLENAILQLRKIRLIMAQVWRAGVETIKVWYCDFVLTQPVVRAD